MAPQGLFRGLSSFSELEERISALPTTLERGDAFEVFAEAYLATQKIVQAEEVWPFGKIPLPVSQQLALDSPRDLGVDGVFKELGGGSNAYQVKFRTGRPSLTWDNLSTLMGLAASSPSAFINGRGRCTVGLSTQTLSGRHR